MAQVFIGFGANLGDKLANIKLAIRSISQDLGQVVVCSSFYESEPWGFDSTELFINGVLELQTSLEPIKLLLGLKKIERTIGREEKTTLEYTDRLIDLDILYYENLSIQNTDLEIPHPRIYDRRFVLEPLVEIAPNFMDMKLGKTMEALLNSCTDTSILKKTLN